jgi:hypothetical protein
MEAQKSLIISLLITVLASTLQAQPLPPAPGGGLFPPPPTEGPEFPECIDPNDCTDPGDMTDGEEEEEENDDPLAGLVEAIASLQDFTEENCNSKKDQAKFQSLLKELKDVVVKLRKIPGLEGEEDLSTMSDQLRSIKADLRDLCVDEEETEEEE